MNFKYLPGLGWHWGYPLLVVFMLIIAAGMIAYFRHRGWIGSADEADPEAE
jgi:magnesium transporter